jgi:hypothetical protein
MKTITRNGDIVSDKEAVIEWLRCALETKKGQVGWLDPNFGIDHLAIMRSSNPESIIEQNIHAICSLRKEIISTRTHISRSPMAITVSIYVTMIQGTAFLSETIETGKL